MCSAKKFHNDFAWNVCVAATESLKMLQKSFREPTLSWAEVQYLSGTKHSRPVMKSLIFTKINVDAFFMLQPGRVWWDSVTFLETKPCRK